MDHIRKAMLEVRNLEPVVMMSAVIRGLRVKGFYHSSKRFFHDLLELLSHFEKYINPEEGMAIKKKDKGEHKHPRGSCPPPPQTKRWKDEPSTAIMKNLCY